MEIKYTNRYNDKYKFLLLPNGNIMWTGPFEYLRCGWPNVYDKAYEQYQADGGTEDIGRFKELVHEYDSKTYIYTELAKKYAPLVYSDTSKIDMVDPSGGPYLARGTDMGVFNKEFSGKIIDYFIGKPEGYEIVIR